MAMMASGVQLNPELTKILGDIGTPQSKNISDSYAKLRGGISPNSDYATSRFNKLGTLAQGNLKSNLEGALGSSSYGDWKSQRDFEQNYALAKLTGELNAPSTLEQVLGGLGGAMRTGGDIYGLYNSFKKPSKLGGSYSSSPETPGYSADIG